MQSLHGLKLFLYWHLDFLFNGEVKNIFDEFVERELSERKWLLYPTLIEVNHTYLEFILFSEKVHLYFTQQNKSKNSFKMMQMIHKMLDWFKSLFWKEEMELTLVGLQHAGMQYAATKYFSTKLKK